MNGWISRLMGEGVTESLLILTVKLTQTDGCMKYECQGLYLLVSAALTCSVSSLLPVF